ncbi:type 4a pilus biogenesis protein PilO [Patescibacteria group bacterium]|nr:type 4a pilus biogenesis protein PilO [Patescibacteria group bacterium]
MKKIAIALICLAAGVALTVWVVKPIWASVMELRDEIRFRNEEIAKIEVLLAKQDELKKKYLGSKDDIDRILLALPKGEDVSYDLSQIDAIAMKNGLLLESIKFTGIDEEGETNRIGLSTTNVEMNLSGSYEAFKGFLRDMENSLRVAEVSSIRISSIKGLEERSLFNFGLNINVYYQ